MSEVEIYATKRVEQRTRMFFHPPFSLKADDLEGTFQMDWDAGIGDHAPFEVSNAVMRDIVWRYEGLKTPELAGFDNKVQWYSDEECIMYCYKDAEGNLYGYIMVPMQDEWEEDFEDSELEVENV